MPRQQGYYSLVQYCPDPARAEDGDSMREAALDPSQPILTPEEIEAFRQL